MKTFTQSSLSTLFILVAFTTFAQAGSVKDVKSLRDLPLQWSGEAGNLIFRTSTSLQINKIVSVIEQKEKDQEITIRYAIEGFMTFGERKIELKEVTFFNRSYVGGNGGSLVFKLNDNFVRTWGAYYNYDEAKNEFVLRDYGNTNRDDQIQMTGTK